MRPFAVLAAAALAATPAAAACPVPDPAFVAFLGQSNMVGFGVTPGMAVQGGYKPDPLTQIWNNQASRFEVMRPGVNSPGGVGIWGPEVGFALAFRAAHPKTPLYVLKTNAGQTSLAPNLNAYDDWAPGSSGEMLDKAVSRADAASRALGKRPDAVFVFQGEADAGDARAAAAYGGRFQAFLAAVRTRLLRRPDGYVGWARIGPGTPHWRTVRDAQAADRAHSFDTDHLTRQRDGVHLDARGLIATGRRYFGLFETRC